MNLKKLASFILLFVFVLVLSSCRFMKRGPDVDNQNEQLYNIYLVGREENLISITYEQWLESIKGEDGVGIKSIIIDSNYDVIVTYSNDQTVNIGNIVGAKGEQGLKGEDGLTPHIGGNGNWHIGLVDLGINAKGPKGDDGREVELDINDNYIRWRYVGEVSWRNLLNLENLKGSDGIDGLDGNAPYIGENGNWFIDGIDTNIKASGPIG